MRAICFFLLVDLLFQPARFAADLVRDNIKAPRNSRAVAFISATCAVKAGATHCCRATCAAFEARPRVRRAAWRGRQPAPPRRRAARLAFLRVRSISS